MQAFPARWFRLLPLLLALAGVALSMPLGAAADRTAGGSTEPAPRRGDWHRRQVSFPAPSGNIASVDSIVLSTGWFSPNGDGFLDEITYAVGVEGPGQLIVQVGTPGLADTLAVVQNDSLGAGRVTATGQWDGRGSDGVQVPDGLYEFRFILIDTLQNISTNLRQFTVDTVFPVIDSVTIDPRPFTPTVLGSAQEPLIRFRVALLEREDIAGVDVFDGADTLQVALLGGFQGAGTYSAPCRVCADSLSDGFNRVEIFAEDRAGNVTTVVDSIDMDILGPQVTLEHPTASLAFVTQTPDSITGKVVDRHIISSLSMLVSGALDTTLVIMTTPGADSTQFTMDVSQLFAAEGTYDLIFPTLDEHGVSDSTHTLTYTVDRTSPPAPVLSPPLSSVIRTLDIIVTVLVDSTAELLHITGAAIPIPPNTIMGPILANIVLPLSPGPNTLVFSVEDFAGNLSVPVTANVFRETTEGLSAPERFRSGNQISIDAGVQASGAYVRIMALDGSVVKTFEDLLPAREYIFRWDLTTPEGRRVRNGAYLVMARVTFANGVTQRYRKMIAVIE